MNASCEWESGSEEGGQGEELLGGRGGGGGEGGPGGHTCCSKGAMPGTNSMAVNSIVPSTLKWECAIGSRNSLKVCLKKASYSSFATCGATPLHM